ncbi:hypothetical protein D3C76_373380 [compost metagenome]
MKKSVNKLGNERGFTLVEVIATVSLASLLAGIIFSIIMFGINSYQKIQIENTLRDEADLLMSSLISELYTFAPDTIQSSANGIELEKTTGTDTVSTQIYLHNGKLQIGSQDIDIRSNIVLPDPPEVDGDNASAIFLNCSRTDTSKCKSGMIEIRLVIGQDNRGHRQQLTLESKFGF